MISNEYPIAVDYSMFQDHWFSLQIGHHQTLPRHGSREPTGRPPRWWPHGFASCHVGSPQPWWTSQVGIQVDRRGFRSTELVAIGSIMLGNWSLSLLLSIQTVIKFHDGLYCSILIYRGPGSVCTCNESKSIILNRATIEIERYTHKQSNFATGEPRQKLIITLISMAKG